MPKKGLPTAPHPILPVSMAKLSLYSGLPVGLENPPGYSVPSSTPGYPHFTALDRATELAAPGGGGLPMFAG